jgi:hypothetical protein
MKALTISQPYATLIADGEKWVENRKWGTSYRGPLAIHAGKGTQYLSPIELAGYHSGCIVATCELVACLPLDSMRKLSPEQAIGKTGLMIIDVLHHEHTEGPFCWILQNVRPLIPPVPCKGAQGLWEWNEGSNHANDTTGTKRRAGVL